MIRKIVSLTARIGHPAFFDPARKLLVEVLPNSTFRITKAEQGREVFMTVSAAAQRARIEDRHRWEGVTSTGTFSLHDLEHRPGRDVYEEGKKLLEECGHPITESREDKEKLNTLLRRVMNGDRVNPREMRPGDCGALLFEDEEDGVYSLTSFCVSGGGPAKSSGSLESSRDVKFVYKNWRRPEEEGIDPARGSWSYDPADVTPRKPVRMDPADHRWLEELADFAAGGSGPREGEKYLREAVKWEKQWHSKSFENPPEVVKMLEGRNLLGGVAV